MSLGDRERKYYNWPGCLAHAAEMMKQLTWPHKMAAGKLGFESSQLTSFLRLNMAHPVIS